MGMHVNDHWNIFMYLVSKNIDYVGRLLKNIKIYNEISNRYFGSLDATKTHMWGCIYCLKMTIRIRYDVVRVDLLLQKASHT